MSLDDFLAIWFALTIVVSWPYSKRLDRIAQETADAEQLLVAVELQARDVEETLRRALTLVSDCNRMYRIASSQLRREFNRVLFERIMIVKGR